MPVQNDLQMQSSNAQVQRSCGGRKVLSFRRDLIRVPDLAVRLIGG